jgi:lipoprotein-anchoring transpeptidase ErfK/SrfK
VTGRLHLLTENGFGEVYLLLRERVMPDGSRWIRVRIPARVGETGWVLRDALGDFRAVRTFLRIDRATLRLTLFRSGRPVFSAPVAVGAQVTPTPGGRFWIREKFHTTGLPWYGPRALGTSAYAPGLASWPNGGVIGVHGTDRPDLVPGRPSHGCIRLLNSDIERLYTLVPRGTPVEIV